MKHFILVTMLVFTMNSYAGWFSSESDQPEIKVGHTWKANESGVCYDITLVDGNRIAASENRSDCLLVTTRKTFLEYYTFVCKPKELEIVAGQTWKSCTSGDVHEVFEVGEKYVVYGYVGGGNKNYPSVTTISRFHDRYELVSDVEEDEIQFIFSDDGGIVLTSDIIFAVAPEKTGKPYLHKNPNNDHWVCSKHGDLEPNDWQVYFDITISFCGSDIYCYDCFSETMNNILNQHILGVKE